MGRWVWLWAAAGCHGGDDDTGAAPLDTSDPPGLQVAYLSPADHLTRASLVLRGIRPTVAELQQVTADPGALPALVDAWVDSAEFGLTMRDLHAELLLVRTDTQFQLPVLGPLAAAGYDQEDVYRATTESPLVFVESVVTQDLPYTTVVTADWMMTNAVLAAMYGLAFDPNGAEWQESRWSDGRPLAGLLSDSELWRRHVSNGYNFHRGRANVVADKFLCEDFASRDVRVEGGVDLADPFAVAEAVGSNPTCVGCHQALDPFAAFFWGYKEQIMRNAVSSAYASSCAYPWDNGIDPDELHGSYRPEHFCYPLKFYEATQQDGWLEYGLPAPAFYGVPASDTADLGQMISEDPRFSLCTVRNFVSYFAQVERNEVPLELATSLRDTFAASGFSAKALAKAIVLSDAFRSSHKTDPRETAFVPDAIVVRPEQYQRQVAALTGFTWETNADPAGCQSPNNTCWENVDLLVTDRFGYRAMFGGVDGLQVTHPIYGATPTKVLVMDVFSGEAAGFVVDADFELPAGERRLFTEVEPTTEDEAAVRGQLVALHGALLGDLVEPNGAAVDATYALFVGALALGDTPAEAWTLVVSAMLQDPRMVFY
jgi:hypothetical protein